MRRTLAVTALALLLTGAAVTDAFASIPDASGVIHGCRKTSDGSLRVRDSATMPACPSGYTALDWSQTGPQGPAGATGPQGPPGQLPASGFTQMTHNYSVIGPAWFHFTLTCAGSNGVDNRIALSGGYDANSESTTSTSTILTGSHPTATKDGWEWWVWRASSESNFITVWLTCLELQ